MKRISLLILVLLWYAAAIATIVSYVQTIAPLIYDGDVNGIFHESLIYYFITAGICIFQILLVWLVSKLYDFDTYSAGSFLRLFLFCLIAPLCLVVNMIRTFSTLWILITQSPD